MAKQTVEIFTPPNLLKVRVRRCGGLDAAAIKRAEAAIEKLKVKFVDWIVVDVNRLTAARETFERARTSEALGILYRASHDLKGQAATFGFPLVARVASSLCRLTDDDRNPGTVPMKLVDAHVDAIRVVVRDGIRDPSDATASVLAAELEQKVDALLSR